MKKRKLRLKEEVKEMLLNDMTILLFIILMSIIYYLSFLFGTL